MTAGTVAPMRRATVLLIALLAVSAAPAAGKLGPNPSDKRLASEFLRLLHDKT